MPENQSNFDSVYQLVMRFVALAVAFGILLILFLAFRFMSRIENLAPAEMRLLLDLFKNRFFQ